MAANGSARGSGGGDDPAERVRKAAKRKWSARAWWLGLHLYNYGVLVYGCASGALALSASDVALLAVVAVASIGCYVALQTSSPGYVERSADDSPSGLESGDAARREDDPLVGDSERLTGVVEVLPDADAGAGVRAPLRFCASCQLTQPLRAKHWCVRLRVSSGGLSRSNRRAECVGAARTAIAASGSTTTSTRRSPLLSLLRVRCMQLTDGCGVADRMAGPAATAPARASASATGANSCCTCVCRPSRWSCS